MNHQADPILRAMTNDGAFRLVAICSTETVRAAVTAQYVRGPTALRFGELLTAAVLVRQTMAPDYRVQLTLHAPSGGRLLADSQPGGLTRGIVTPSPTGASIEVGGLLQVSRTVLHGRLHESVVDLGHAATISDALMAYMQDSEQITSFAAVSYLPEAPDMAGGFIVQLLPDAPRDTVEAMTVRLEGLPPFDELLRRTGGDLAALTDELLAPLPYTLLGEDSLHFGCVCDLERVVGAIATLDRGAVAELAAAGKPLEIDCDYCHQKYTVPVEQLTTLLERS